MKCPLCFELVISEDLLQEHYLTTCAGLADLSDDSVNESVQALTTKTKFQFISTDPVPDPEIFLLSTLPDTPQLTLTKVSSDLYQSEMMTVPKGEFEGQVVIGEDVLSVAPFSTNKSIITLHITNFLGQEIDTWSSKSSKSALSRESKRSTLSLSHTDTTSTQSDQSEPSKRKSLSADSSKVAAPRYDSGDSAPRSDINVLDNETTDSSLHYADKMAGRTSSKDSIEPREKRPVASSRWARRRRKHKRAASTGSVSSSQDLFDNTLVNEETHRISSDSMAQEKEVQDLKAEISKLRIENRNQAKELNTLTKVIDGPVCPLTEVDILKRDNGDLKQELGELRNLMLKQEKSHNKKIETYKSTGDPIDDWRKAQVEKLQKQVIESERMMEEANISKMSLEEEVSKAKEKITQLRETRDTMRNSMNQKSEEMKRATSKLQDEISQLHTKYMEQGQELAATEDQGKRCEEFQMMIEKLTVDNNELSKHNSQLILQVSDLQLQMGGLQNKVTSKEIEMDYKLKKELSPYKYNKRNHPLIKNEEQEYEKEYISDDINEDSKDEKVISWDNVQDNKEPVLKPVNLTNQYYTKPLHVTSNTAEEDETYKEALSIVEKYKRMDLEKSSLKEGREVPNNESYGRWSNGVKFDSTPLRTDSRSLYSPSVDYRHHHTESSRTHPTENKNIAESQSLESRPQESRPLESRPLESRPLESRPLDSRPLELRPLESRPLDSRPSDSRPLEEAKYKNRHSYMSDTNYPSDSNSDTRETNNRVRGGSVRGARSVEDYTLDKPNGEERSWSATAWLHQDSKTYDSRTSNSNTYEPRDSTTYDPRESKTYDPKDSKTYDTRDTKTHDTRDSKIYDYRDSKTYESRDSKTYNPKDSKTYDPKDSKTYDTRDTKSYDNRDTKTYDTRDFKTYNDNDRSYDNGGYKNSYCGRTYSMDSLMPCELSASKGKEIKNEFKDRSNRSTQSNQCKRSIKPESVSEIPLNSRVVFKRGSELERGTARYTGRLIGKDGQFVGVELNTNTGNHDGTFQGHTYFSCKPKRGVFVPLNKVQLVYPS